MCSLDWVFLKTWRRKVSSHQENQTSPDRLFQWPERQRDRERARNNERDRQTDTEREKTGWDNSPALRDLMTEHHRFYKEVWDVKSESFIKAFQDSYTTHDRSYTQLHFSKNVLPLKMWIWMKGWHLQTSQNRHCSHLSASTGDVRPHLSTAMVPGVTCPPEVLLLQPATMVRERKPRWLGLSFSTMLWLLFSTF